MISFQELVSIALPDELADPSVAALGSKVTVITWFWKSVKVVTMQPAQLHVWVGDVISPSQKSTICSNGGARARPASPLSWRHCLQILYASKKAELASHNSAVLPIVWEIL